jgi:ABC-type Na+ efflux pump permease subunit
MKYYFRNKFSLLSVIVIPPLILMSLALTVFTYEGKGFSIGIVTDYYRSNELDSALNILIVEIDTTIGSAGNIESKKENISYGYF